MPAGSRRSPSHELRPLAMGAGNRRGAVHRPREDRHRRTRHAGGCDLRESAAGARGERRIATWPRPSSRSGFVAPASTQSASRNGMACTCGTAPARTMIRRSVSTYTRLHQSLAAHARRATTITPPAPSAWPASHGTLGSDVAASSPSATTMPMHATRTLTSRIRSAEGLTASRMISPSSRHSCTPGCATTSSASPAAGACGLT